MASRTRVVIHGDEELARRVKALQSGTAEKQILQEFGAFTVRLAKKRVPRRTGNLGRTIRVDKVDVARQTIKVVAGGRRNVGYAHFVEFGTKGGKIIVPKRARVLAWGGPRRLSGALRAGAKPTSFAMRVTRGSTRAQPYLMPSAKDAIRAIDKAGVVIEAWNKAA